MLFAVPQTCTKLQQFGTERDIIIRNCYNIGQTKASSTQTVIIITSGNSELLGAYPGFWNGVWLLVLVLLIITLDLFVYSYNA